jgi:micrococcal nuclease
MNKIAIFFLCIFLLVVSNALAFKPTLQTKVMQVKDGDTIVVRPVDGGEFSICRLYGIDAPEAGKQPYGEESTKKLKKLILGQEVTIEVRDRDRYGREVCVIKKESMDINLEMVKEGAAWAYRKYLKIPYASEYIDAESQARAKRLGLWKDGNPEPPWKFRRLQRGR